MIYLLHFSTPLSGASHYMGYCEPGNLESRLKRHKQKKGARIMAAVVEAGIEACPVRLWPDGTRDQERSLKNRKEAKVFCPICNPTGAKNNGNFK